MEESRKKYGSNVIPDSEPTTFWAEFKETFKDPMIRILLAIAALMIVMCALATRRSTNPGTIVAVLIVAFVSAKTGVASDTKYRQLKDSTKKDQCKVYRNGVVAVIDVDDVVVGDKVLLQSGDKIPADGVLIHGQLKVDNSALNGEAEECPKTRRTDPSSWPEDITGDTFVDKPTPCSGARCCLTARACWTCSKVGLATMMGKMAEEMQEDEPDSPLKVKLAKLADMISRFGYIGAVVIAVLYFGYFILSAGGLAAYFSWRDGDHQGRGGGRLPGGGHHRLRRARGPAPDDLPGADAEHQQDAGPQRAGPQGRGHRDRRLPEHPVQRQDRHHHQGPSGGGGVLHRRRLPSPWTAGPAPASIKSW